MCKEIGVRSSKEDKIYRPLATRLKGSSDEFVLELIVDPFSKLIKYLKVVRLSNK
jgi:hypothetical protein